jgi:hypothetical protein
MLAFGGMPLDSTQVRAVAAYVHSLGRDPRATPPPAAGPRPP